MTTAPTAVAEGELGRSPAVEIPKNFWKWIQTSLKTLEEHYKSNRDFMLFVRCLDGDSFEDSVLVATRSYELSLDGETLSIQLQDSNLEIQEKLVTFLRALLGKEHEVAPTPPPMPPPAPRPAPGHRDILVFPGRVTPDGDDDEVERIVEDGRRQARDEIKEMRERVKKDIAEANREVEKARADFERQMEKVRRRRRAGGSGGISDKDTDPNSGRETPSETPDQATDQRVREFLEAYRKKTFRKRKEGIAIGIENLTDSEWQTLETALRRMGFEALPGKSFNDRIIRPTSQTRLKEATQEELNELCQALSLESKKDATALYEMRDDLPKLEQWVINQIRTRVEVIVKGPLKVQTNFANDCQSDGSLESQEFNFPPAATPAFRMKLFVEENCIIAQVTSVANRPQPGRGR